MSEKYEIWIDSEWYRGVQDAAKWVSDHLGDISLVSTVEEGVVMDEVYRQLGEEGA